MSDAIPLRRPEPEESLKALHSLAEAYGLQLAYHDIQGREVRASPESLRGALEALGVPVETRADVEDSLWQRRLEEHLRLVEPVTVSWEGEPPAVELHPARAEQGQRVECRLSVEGGEAREWVAEGARIELPPDLPTGYHRLEVEVAERRAATQVIRAPATTWDPERRRWGVFLPLYALRTRNSGGTGDFSGLAALLDWTRALGGEHVATTPLLAAFLDTPFDPSPYAPVSRLFLNELYVDPAAAPELPASSEARALLASDELRERVRKLQRARLVDYREAMAWKRRVLEPLARTFFEGDGWRAEPYVDFLAGNPEVRDYARFRAACESFERGWREWPPSLRDGTLDASDLPEEPVRFYLYAQWLAASQLSRAAAPSNGTAGLYLDLPLGVHPDGYDAWRYRHLFADRARVGAPPDDFFGGGQDWGFRPLHPSRIREDGYRYVAAGLRAQCRYAAVLRIDHVMGLHRQWWVPEGMAASEGVYVRYRPEELWAVTCLESRRARTEIVGEDLGTVPPEVREEMERRRARRVYVVPFEIREDPPGLYPVPPLAAASLGTHDMPPFARWWARETPERRRALVAALEQAGSLAPVDPSALPESERPRPVLEAALRWLSDSAARLVVANLEDLWLETRPQNEPGTTMAERPNWRRKARFAFETFSEMPEVVETLRNRLTRR